MVGMVILVFCFCGSPSTRRAWIEILIPIFAAIALCVALHPEGVDRNSPGKSIHPGIFMVALHPEGVDRNTSQSVKSYAGNVALHPEGVDRNTKSYG